MFTSELIIEILALGALALAITQAIKKWVNTKGTVALIISAIVAVLLGLYRTLSVPPYDWPKFIILVIGIFLESNGIYHFGSYAIGKKVKEKG